MKLNLGCGRNIKEGFINVDSYERDHPLDVVCDLVREFPWSAGSVDYIYAEQLIEHFNWLEGREFLVNCYLTLREGGTLRLVLPDYRKIFQAYLDNDSHFFKSFKKDLNKNDFRYYQAVYLNPQKILEERPNKPPPSWHTSNEPEDRKRLKLRLRVFEHNIDVVHWFTHQFGEHLTLWDFWSLCTFMWSIGFTEVNQSKYKKGFDSDNPGRIKSSLYMEAIK